MIEARIKLAEAMGWFEVQEGLNGKVVGHPSKQIQRQLHNFDPFTDANDDYAVLLWARASIDLDFCEFSDSLRKVMQPVAAIDEAYPWDYVLGDFARAACLNLNIQLPSQESDK